ncbi:Glutamate--cysteine ligase chloroplastic [Bienertia sinuspersici]
MALVYQAAVPLSMHAETVRNEAKTNILSSDNIKRERSRGFRTIVAASPPTEDPVVAAEPLTKEDLVEYLLSGCKSKRNGAHEYEQISELLNVLVRDLTGIKIMEGDYIIGLKQGSKNISLEPGGQFELSGAPLETLHQTCAEVNSHLYQVKAVAEEMGIGFLGIGFQPKWGLKDIPMMPREDMIL